MAFSIAVAALRCPPPVLETQSRILLLLAVFATGSPGVAFEAYLILVIALTAYIPKRALYLKRIFPAMLISPGTTALAGQQATE